MQRYLKTDLANDKVQSAHSQIGSNYRDLKFQEL